jgi:hypothetical protein
MRGAPRCGRLVAAIALALVAWALHGQAAGDLRPVADAGRQVIGPPTASSGADAATLGRIGTVTVTVADMTKRMAEGALVAVLVGLAVMIQRRRFRPEDHDAGWQRAAGRIDFAPLRGPPSL